MIKSVYLEEIKNELKTSKNGKPYTACSIKVDNQWLNGFGGNTTKAWAAGQTVKIDTYEEEYNGKMYKKFKYLKEEDLLKERVEVLERRMDECAKVIANLQKILTSTKT